MMKMKWMIAPVAMTAVLSAAPSTVGAKAPTFNHDVAPILYANCAGCHRPGEVAPFALLTYQDAAKRAKQIAAITQARVMPPWKATPGYGDFKDVRRLSDSQLATIREWALNGAPEGDPSEKPTPPKFSSGWQGGQPDQVVKMESPYSLPAEGPDRFRCFVIPLNASSDEYVKQVEFRPGNAKIVHHAILFLDTSGSSRKKEEAPGQGYECVGGAGIDLAGGLGGWAPGAMPAPLPDGVAATIKQGADLVMQIHYHLDGKPETDQSTVGLTFAKEPPTKGLTSLLFGNVHIDIPPGEKNYVVHASAQLPADAEAISIFPHSHYLGRDMKVEAKLPDGTVKPMIWIKDWDFNWQGAYRYQDPVKLPKGTELDMTYSFDNSAENPRNPSNPPREVTFGEQTTNEMAFTFVSLTLASPAEVADFRKNTNAQFTASVIENGAGDAAFGGESKRLQMVFNMFDKNHDGKIDADEHAALVHFLETRPSPFERRRENHDTPAQHQQ